MNRKFLCDQLNVTESSNSQSVPLIYSLINYFIQNSETKHLPLVCDRIATQQPQGHVFDYPIFAKSDSDKSSKSDSISDFGNTGLPRVYTARDYLRDRSSYSSSSSSQINK